MQILTDKKFPDGKPRKRIVLLDDGTKESHAWTHSGALVEHARVSDPTSLYCLRWHEAGFLSRRVWSVKGRCRTHEYSPEGRLTKSLEFYRGAMHGRVRTYGADGQVVSEEWYVQGKKTSRQRFIKQFIHDPDCRLTPGDLSALGRRS